MHAPVFCPDTGTFDLLSWIDQNWGWGKTLWLKVVGVKGLWKGRANILQREASKETMNNRYNGKAMVMKGLKKVSNKTIKVYAGYRQQQLNEKGGKVEKAKGSM